MTINKEWVGADVTIQRLRTKWSSESQAYPEVKSGKWEVTRWILETGVNTCGLTLDREVNSFQRWQDAMGKDGDIKCHLGRLDPEGLTKTILPIFTFILEHFN